jgi:hypothetical protein
MNKKIEIIVSPNGEISINAVGFKGADCEKATRAMEEALGTVAQRTHKPEFQARATTKHHQKLGA